MDIYEELAMLHLTQNGKVNVFVCPQFSIANDHSCPDFVALDIKNKTVFVVEVSAAWNLEKLVRRVLDREKHWLSKLKAQLLEGEVIDHSWERFQVVLYVRKHACAKFRMSLGESRDVVLHFFEDIGFPWSWLSKEERDEVDALAPVIKG